MKPQDEYWNIDPNSGAVLQALIHAQKPKNILEVGTSNGYSAILMGNVASLYGGNITTIEFFDERVKLAKENIATEGLSETIEVIQGDAVEIMSQLAVSSRPPSRDPGAWIPGPADAKAMAGKQARNDNLNKQPPSFDFIFLDANKEEYALYFQYAMQIITPHGIIIADNTLSHAKKLTEFFTVVQKEPRAHAIRLAIGTGLMMISVYP